MFRADSLFTPLSARPLTSQRSLRKPLFAVLALLALPLAGLGAQTALGQAQKPQNNSSRPFVVFLDAAHGGADPGVKISPALEEKRVTLELALYLQKRLAEHGIAVVMARTTDTDPSKTLRAELANHAQPAACILLHATASGAGVHLFTSSLPQAKPSAAPPWLTAQAEYRTQSDQLLSSIDEALTPTGIPVLIGHTYLDPLDEMTCPAVALELAPMESGSITRGETLADPHYQTQVVEALVNALLAWQKNGAWQQNGAEIGAGASHAGATP